MRKRGGVEFRAKVLDDDGLIRGRVPCPLLKVMGARPGDYLVFRLSSLAEAVLSVSRPAVKSSKAGSRKEGGGKRRR